MISSFGTKSSEKNGSQGFVSFYSEVDRQEVFESLIELLHFNKVMIKNFFFYDSKLPPLDETEDKETIVYDICFTFETPLDAKKFYKVTRSFRDQLCTL